MSYDFDVYTSSPAAKGADLTRLIEEVRELRPASDPDGCPGPVIVRRGQRRTYCRTVDGLVLSLHHRAMPGRQYEHRTRDRWARRVWTMRLEFHVGLLEDRGGATRAGACS